MSKTIRNKFYNHLTFIKLVEAYRRAAEGKTSQKDVILFEMDLESNIANLLYKIKNKQYRMGEYHEFVIYEPKERTIKSLPFIDRIVHQWYVEEFIKPFFVPRFISDTYACLENKGTHKAVDMLQKYMRIMKRKYKNYYVLKCDVRKYFYTIDKDILYEILKKRIKDKDLLDLTEVIIYDNEEKKGIPIGNYTSQFFANIYLNELDHYIKEKLRVKYYLRYMDDFLLLVETREEAKEYKKLINEFLAEHLKLELNEKSKYYPNKMGVDFCGYRVFETHRLLRKRSKDKIKKLIKHWNKLYKLGKLDMNNVIRRWNSWKGHAKHANTYNLRCRYLEKMDFKGNLEI